jgi:hypothetical protein
MQRLYPAASGKESGIDFLDMLRHCPRMNLKRKRKFPSITIKLTSDQIQNIRTMNAKVNGALGGMAKSARKAKSSRRNGKLAVVAA